MTAEPRTEWTLKLSTGQTLVVCLTEDGGADFNIECDVGDSSLLTLKVRLSEVCPFIITTAREVAAATCREVAYGWQNGPRLQFFKVSPAGRVEQISENARDRFHICLGPL